jgi:hypothetical protein
MSALNDDPRFSPLGGSIAALICMHTIPEWIVEGMCLVLGYYLLPMKSSVFEANYHGTSRLRTAKILDDEEIGYGAAL